MNAIILAAGMGTRLRPLTDEIPKCLVKVNGEPIVERQIQFLLESGITDITLVSGYHAEKLEPLRKNYGVDIVFNEHYDCCNNIYSMYKVLDRFGGSWVLEGDVFVNRNCFTSNIAGSTYFAKWHEHYENEWGLVADDADILSEIRIGSGKGCVMSGISYWSERDAKQIGSEIRRMMREDKYEEFFWDNAVLNLHRQMEIRVKRFDDIYEIDTEKELRQVEVEITKGK